MNIRAAMAAPSLAFLMLGLITAPSLAQQPTYELLKPTFQNPEAASSYQLKEVPPKFDHGVPPPSSPNTGLPTPDPKDFYGLNPKKPAQRKCLHYNQTYGQCQVWSMTDEEREKAARAGVEIGKDMLRTQGMIQRVIGGQ